MKKYLDSREGLLKLHHEYSGRMFLMKSGVVIFFVVLIPYLAQPYFLEPEEYLMSFERLIIVGTFSLGGAYKFYFGAFQLPKSLKGQQDGLGND